MLGSPETKQYPAVNPRANVLDATASDPVLLYGTVSQDYLFQLDLMAIEHTGQSIREMAGDRPRDAYVWLGHLFKNVMAVHFIDPVNEDWSPGSVKQDGPRAFEALTRYAEERRKPDPDVDEIDVSLGVWKRHGLWKRLRGSRYFSEEVLRFRVGPEDLAV